MAMSSRLFETVGTSVAADWASHVATCNPVTLSCRFGTNVAKQDTLTRTVRSRNQRHDSAKSNWNCEPYWGARDLTTGRMRRAAFERKITQRRSIVSGIESPNRQTRAPAEQAGITVQIRELTIERFRGIKDCTWRPGQGVICLIGSGDSTKTTILDAIELVLGSRWAVGLTDTDFYQCITDEPLKITATVGQLPAELLSEDKYGLDIRGWSAEEGLHDEPESGDEAVLTVVFSADDSLEPAWRIVNDRRPDGRNFPSRDREALGLVRLGSDVDRHLSWGRGSALTRNTDDLKEVNRVVCEAQREARGAVAEASLTKLKAAAALAQTAAEKLGVRVVSEYRPGLEASSVSVSVGQLALHDGDIPVTASGLGSRRLNALALQTMSVAAGAILLVDEVEHGLEPHRLRHLLRELQKAPGDTGQVFLTTHSEIPLEELKSGYLHVVRSDEGVTEIRHVGKALQRIARSNPEAMLARRILVCEGKTEIGLCAALRDTWASDHGDIPMAHTGTAPAYGEGKNTGQRAADFAALGYETALFGDSDEPPLPSELELRQAGVKVFVWPGTVCTEMRIALDLPWTWLQQVVDLAVSNYDEQRVIDAIKARLPGKPKFQSIQLDGWLEEADEDAIRKAIGEAAHEKKWFKDIARGEELGYLVLAALDEISESPLAKTLARVGKWVYA